MASSSPDERSRYSVRRRVTTIRSLTAFASVSDQERFSSTSPD
jgi:hypothetical protein